MKEQKSGIDEFIEKLNGFFSLILGKKNGQKQNQQKKLGSTTSFNIIVLLSILLLWVVTGFYYIADNQFGIILHSGRVVAVKYGSTVGLTYPYPFGDVVVLDKAQSGIVNTDESEDNILLSRDLAAFDISSNFSYKVTDAKKLYTKYVQDPDDWDTQVIWQVQSALHDFVANQNESSLLTVSLTELSTAIKQKLKNSLDNEYGIDITSFNLVSIKPHDINVQQSTNLDIKVESKPLDTKPNLRTVDRNRDLSMGWE